MKPSYLFILLLVPLLFLSASELNPASLKSDADLVVEEKVYPRLPTANLFEAIDLMEAQKKPQVPQLPNPSNLDHWNPINQNDLNRKWYLGEKRKDGTPDSWIRQKYDGQIMWMSPSYSRTLKEEQLIASCQETGGEYQFSCFETHREDCYHGPSQCVCPENDFQDGDQSSYLAKDYPGNEGCLLYDADTDEFIQFSEEDEVRGYYLGPKKLKTPPHWSLAPAKPGNEEMIWRPQ